MDILIIVDEMFSGLLFDEESRHNTSDSMYGLHGNNAGRPGSADFSHTSSSNSPVNCRGTDTLVAFLCLEQHLTKKDLTLKSLHLHQTHQIGKFVRPASLVMMSWASANHIRVYLVVPPFHMTMHPREPSHNMEAEPGIKPAHRLLEARW